MLAQLSRKLERDGTVGHSTPFRSRSRICVTRRASARWAAPRFSEISYQPLTVQLSPNCARCGRRCVRKAEPFGRSSRRVQLVLRCPSQPVAGGPMAGRVVERVGGSYRGGLVFRRHRDRYRGIDSLSRISQWRCGPEANLWPGEPLRGAAHGAFARPRRAHRTTGG